MSDLHNLRNKINIYQEIRNNTIVYRKAWQSELKPFIIERLEYIIKETGLHAEIEKKEGIKNLEGIILTLGKERSGIGEKISSDATRPLIKHNGLLLYQQLFNGKIQVTIVYPFIEGYGQQIPSKMIAIYRPEEIKEPFIIRHFEEFIREINGWEDFDDDLPVKSQRIGFNPHMDINDNVVDQ